MELGRAQALHDVLARLKPRGRTVRWGRVSPSRALRLRTRDVRVLLRATQGGLGLGALGAKGKSTSICEPGDPKAGLYAHFVRAGAGGHHRFDEQELEAEQSCETKKTTKKTKKKKLKEDRVSVADAPAQGAKRKKKDDEPAPSASSKKKQNKTGEATFVSAACAPFSDEAATPKSPAARLAKLERRLKKACRSGDKAAEGTLRVKVEKMRRKAQKQREQPNSPP